MDQNKPETYHAYLKALMNISQAITSDLYLEDILKLIVMVTARVMNVEICSLWLVDETATPPIMRLKATQAIEPAYVKDRRLGLSEGVVGWVFSHQRPLQIENVLKDERFKEKQMARRMGLVSMLGVPLRANADRVCGVLNCFTSQPYRFSEDEINLITTVANQATVAILNTELMVQTRVIQEELETRKLTERAKEVLMRRRQLSGAEAYRWIQKRSMDTRKSMRWVAEAILLSEEL
jgi:signal transduction protein with GAF and PtsI domain